MSTATVTVHLGAVPINGSDWTDQPLDGIATPGWPYPRYEGDSFREWGESFTPGWFGDPHHITVDIDAHVEPGHENCTGGTCLTRESLDEVSQRAREVVVDLLPAGWRLVDYVVVTDCDDHSDGARTVGMWGA